MLVQGSCCWLAAYTADTQIQSSTAQVDVRVLKEDLWSSLQQLEPDATCGPAPADPSDASQPAKSFQEVISSMEAASSGQQQAEVSVHLCFICMLHLANEHGLHITGVPTLDSMSVALAQ